MADGRETDVMDTDEGERQRIRHRAEIIWPRAGAPEALPVETADLVGADSISVVWNDTHRTGIYSSETLRAWCHCPLCASGE